MSTARTDTSSETGITASAFAAAMRRHSIADNAHLAVAVSGGADSMALLRLLHGWGQPRGIRLTALTVDHGLRAESTTEARQVAAWCESLGIEHVTLTWAEGPAQRMQARSMQAAARTARYGLMTAWCRARDGAALCLAHHADDQIETFLMRLTRGSGLEGLAAMAPAIRRDGVMLLRPLLAFPKTSLVATCNEMGQGWIEDPSNQNTAATRVRFRQARGLLEREGLTSERLLETIGHLQRARTALNDSVRDLVNDACRWDAFGVARFAWRALSEASEETALRALAHVLIVTSGATYGPRFERLQRLFAALVGGPWRDATLHGCLIQRDRDDIVIVREAAAITDDLVLMPSDSLVWDGRFRLSLAASAPKSLRVTALTQSAWATAAVAIERAVPPAVRATIPMLVDDYGPVTIPLLGFPREDARTLWKEGDIRCEFVPNRSVAELPPLGDM